MCCGVGSESTEMKQKNKLLLSWVQKCRVVAEGTKVQLAIFYGIQQIWFSDIALSLIKHGAWTGE